MNKSTIIFQLAALFLALSACKGTPPITEDVLTDSTTTFIDTIPAIDSTLLPEIDTVVIDSSGYINEENALASIIEQKYGEQWDFCDCVVKNDSVNKAIEIASDDQFDAILDRMDVIDSHCKEMLTAANRTPDERARHERKVNKCLKNAK